MIGRTHSLRGGHSTGLKGFTLIELLVTISIVAILLTVTVPSFTELILSQHVRTSASDLQTALFYARSEAIKRAAEVDVAPTGGNWRNGWTVQLTNGTVLRSQGPLNAQLASMSGTTIAYQADGHIPPPVIQPIVVYASGHTHIAARCLVVDLGGRPSLVTDTDGDPANGCN